MPQISLDKLGNALELAKPTGEVLKAIQDTGSDGDWLTKMTRIFSEVNKFIDKMPKPAVDAEVVDRTPRQLPEQTITRQPVKDDKISQVIPALLNVIEPYLERCQDNMTIGEAIAKLDILKVGEVKSLLAMYKQSQVKK